MLDAATYCSLRNFACHCVSMALSLSWQFGVLGSKQKRLPSENKIEMLMSALETALAFRWWS